MDTNEIVRTTIIWDLEDSIKKKDAEIERLRDENKRLRDERMQIAHSIIEDEARISKARRYVVRVDNKDVE